MLSQHQNIFDIILDYSVGLVWLSKKSATVSFGLERRVGDFVPENWSQVVKANALRADGVMRVQRNHEVSSVVSTARKANIPSVTDEPSSGYQYAVAVAPHFVDLI